MNAYKYLGLVYALLFTGLCAWALMHKSPRSADSAPIAAAASTKPAAPAAEPALPAADETYPIVGPAYLGCAVVARHAPIVWTYQVGGKIVHVIGRSSDLDPHTQVLRCPDGKLYTPGGAEEREASAQVPR